jgi:predicted nucleic acid-binding protein
MRDNIFLDTNILVYAYTDDDIKKHSIAKNLLSTNLTDKNVFISTQVISEFYCAMSKYKRTHNEISTIISEIIENTNMTLISIDI